MMGDGFGYGAGTAGGNSAAVPTDGESARVFAWNVMVGIALLSTSLSLVFWREKL